MQNVQPSKFLPLKSSMAVGFSGDAVLHPASAKIAIKKNFPIEPLRRFSWAKHRGRRAASQVDVVVSCLPIFSRLTML